MGYIVVCLKEPEHIHGLNSVGLMIRDDSVSTLGYAIKRDEYNFAGVSLTFLRKIYFSP